MYPVGACTEVCYILWPMKIRTQSCNSGGQSSVYSLPHKNLSCTESETYNMFIGKTQTLKMIEKENQIKMVKKKKKETSAYNFKDSPFFRVIKYKDGCIASLNRILDDQLLLLSHFSCVRLCANP